MRKMRKCRFYGVLNGKILTKISDDLQVIEDLIKIMKIKTFCIVYTDKRYGWIYDYFINNKLVFKLDSEKFSTLAKSEREFLLKNA